MSCSGNYINFVVMDDQIMNQTLSDIRCRLSEKFPKGETDAFIRIIFRHVMGYEPVDILLHKDSVLPGFIVVKIHKVVDELLKNRPIQYIFRQTYFHGHVFEVDSSTLIPRPETEELVDLIVDRHKESDLRVLDAGTGSGCIAVSLALALKFSSVTAIDVSEDALKVARRNAESLKAKVEFVRTDILTLKPTENVFDIIVSNPPYIAESERKGMDLNVLDYEPSLALFVPDADPLKFYRALAAYGVIALVPGGCLYFEINSRFPDEMRQMLLSFGYRNIEIILDMQRLPRFVVAEKGECNG